MGAGGRKGVGGELFEQFFHLLTFQDGVGADGPVAGKTNQQGMVQVIPPSLSLQESRPFQHFMNQPPEVLFLDQRRSGPDRIPPFSDLIDLKPHGMKILQARRQHQGFLGSQIHDDGDKKLDHRQQNGFQPVF